MPYTVPELLVALILPGVLAVVAGAVWRWKLKQSATWARLLSGIVLVLGLCCGFWATSSFESLDFHEPGLHWLPVVATLGVLISWVDLVLRGFAGRVIQALLFLAFLPTAAWLLAPDYKVHAELRWEIVAGLAGVIGIAWCATEWTAYKQKGRFPFLLGPILIAVMAAVVGAGTLGSVAIMCGTVVASLAGLALFAGEKQQPILRTAAAFYPVALTGLMYAAYSGDFRAFRGTELSLDLAFALLGCSMCLLPLYVFCRKAEKPLSWLLGLILTAVIVAPAAVGAIWLATKSLS